MKKEKNELAHEQENLVLQCKLNESQLLVKSLRRELFLTRKSFGTVNEELKTINVQLQHVNLELQSINEELYGSNTILQKKLEQILKRFPSYRSNNGRQED